MSVLFSASGLACECVQTSLADRVRANDVIFLGKPASLASNGDFLITTFVVKETLKGERLPERVIYESMATQCMYVFDEGVELVFAHEVDGRVQHEGYCALPQVGDTEEDIRRLVKAQVGEAEKAAP